MPGIHAWLLNRSWTQYGDQAGMKSFKRIANTKTTVIWIFFKYPIPILGPAGMFQSQYKTNTGNSPKAQKHPLGPGNRNFSCRPSSKQRNSLWPYTQNPYTFIHRKRKKEKTLQLRAVVIQTQRQVVFFEPKKLNEKSVWKCYWEYV